MIARGNIYDDSRLNSTPALRLIRGEETVDADVVGLRPMSERLRIKIYRDQQQRCRQSREQRSSGNTFKSHHESFFPMIYSD